MNANKASVNVAGVRTTMAYDVENRMSLYQAAGTVSTHLYSADNLKRVEYTNGVRTTLVWDGQKYLQGRS